MISYMDEQDLGSMKTSGWWFADWKWEDGFIFRVLSENGKEGVFVIFFFLLEGCMDVNKVGFCDLSLMEHGTEMFSWGLFYVVNLGIFSCILCETLFRIIKCRGNFFISTIYWVVNFIFVKSGLKLMFSDFFQAFRSRTPLLRKKSTYLVRLEGISNDDTWIFLI